MLARSEVASGGTGLAEQSVVTVRTRWHRSTTNNTVLARHLGRRAFTHAKGRIGCSCLSCNSVCVTMLFRENTTSVPPFPQARSQNSHELQQVTRTKCTLLYPDVRTGLRYLFELVRRSPPFIPFYQATNDSLAMGMAAGQDFCRAAFILATPIVTLESRPIFNSQSGVDFT
jgi:hypothetical protein